MRDDRVQHDWVLDWEAPPVANTRVGLYNEARLKGAYDELEEKPVVYSTPAELETITRIGGANVEIIED